MTIAGDWARGIDVSPVLPLARALVSIPSENPPGSTAMVCRAVASELESARFTVTAFEPADGFVSIVARHVFPAPGPTLLLNGHVDVVPVGPQADEWTHDPWGGGVEGGRLFGRGSLDMKGPLAGLIVAAEAVVRSSLPLGGELVVAAVADEEAGGHRGTGALVEAGALRADAALIAEPGDGGIVVAHRGMCFAELRTYGRSAHASMPEKGVNAVEAMVDVLTACRTLQFRHEPHPRLGAPGLAIGTMISGGVKENVIPPSCRATLDIRAIPGMTREGVLKDLRSHFRASLPADGQPEIEFLVWSDPGETDGDAEIVRLAADAFEREFGRPAERRGMPGATDGWWLAERLGIPTVMGLAPGGVEGCHIVDESIDVGELERYTRVYADLIATYLAVSGA